jgi:hypothetical protein
MHPVAAPDREGGVRVVARLTSRAARTMRFAHIWNGRNRVGRVFYGLPPHTPAVTLPRYSGAPTVSSIPL